MRAEFRDYADFLSFVSQVCGVYVAYYYQASPTPDNDTLWIVSDDGNVVIKYIATGAAGLPGTFLTDFPAAIALNARLSFPANM